MTQRQGSAGTASEWSKDSMKDLGKQWLFTSGRTPEKVWAIIFYLKSSTYNAPSLTKHLHFRLCALTGHLIREKISFQFLEQKKKKKKFYRLILQLVLKLWTYVFLSFTVYFFAVSSPVALLLSRERLLWEWVIQREHGSCKPVVLMNKQENIFACSVCEIKNIFYE